MRIQPTVATVVGPTQKTQWGQVFISPNAYAVVEVEDPNDAQMSGVTLLTTLSHRLQDPPRSLEALDQLVQEVVYPHLRTLIVLIPLETSVLLALHGEGSIHLKRDTSFSTLLAGPGSISGRVTKDDTLLLVSCAVGQALTVQEIANVFDHLDPAAIAEKLTLAIHTHEDGSGGAALIFRVADLIGAEREALPPSAQNEAMQRPFKRVWKRLQLRPLITRLGLGKHIRSFWNSPKRSSMLLSTIIATIFILSVLMGLLTQRGKKQSAEFESARVEATHAYEEGVALIPLNPVKGRERLSSAKTILDPWIASVSPRSTEGRKLHSLYKQITENLEIAMHRVTGEPELFFDAALIKAGATISNFAYEGQRVGLVDRNGRGVYALNIVSKKSEVIAGGDQFRGGANVALHGDTLYTLVDEGIHAVQMTGRQVSPLVVRKEDSWGNIQSLASFGGNLYLLDTIKSRIWKYVRTGETQKFSELREYLNPDSFPDLSGATNMAIDGSVWVGTRVGKILRFTQGRENTFLPQGVDPALGLDLTVYTSDTVNNVYVLDTQNKRVVVLDKEGLYLAQYTWESALLPTQIVVSEEQKKILLLIEGKIYSLELK